MKITVQVPDEIAILARARGLKLEALIEGILSEFFPSQPASEPRTPAEVRAWLDSLAEFSDKIPPLPGTISREWIYGEK